MVLVLQPERMQPLSEYVRSQLRKTIWEQVQALSGYSYSLKPSLMAAPIARAFLELDIPQAQECDCRPLDLPDPCSLDNPTR